MMFVTAMAGNCNVSVFSRTSELSPRLPVSAVDAMKCWKVPSRFSRRKKLERWKLQQTMELTKMNRTQRVIGIISCFCFLLFYEAFGQSQKRPTVADNPMQVEVKAYLKHIHLPQGFKIDLFAENVEGARSMA